jgi:glycosyltransferase involved in cell wall biosynthesis
MRVLLTIHQFPPDSRAGADLYTYYVAKGLLRAGHEVHVLYRSAGTPSEVAESVYDGIPYTVIRKNIRWTPSMASFDVGRDERVDRVFADLVRTIQPDVVHFNHLLGLSTELPRLARSAGVPTVFTLHDYWLFCARINLLEGGEHLCSGAEPAKCANCIQLTGSSWPDWQPGNRGWVAGGKRTAKAILRSAFEKPRGVALARKRAAGMAGVIRFTNLFVAPSQFLMGEVIRHGVPPGKIVYCDYGMADELFSVPVSRTAKATGRLRFGFVGTMIRQKGIGVLMEAWRAFPNADLILYGRDSSELQKYGDVLTQGNVQFRGLLLDHDKAAAFAELDALVVPSIWYENSPLVIHEAFLAGLPVVTSDIGGMAELVTDRSNGLHFRRGDPIDLRAKLTWLCAHPSELDRMRQHMPPVKAMADHIPELIGIYNRAARPAALSGGLPTVADPAGAPKW